MKSALPFLSLAFVFASCSTAYKSGQTPDDVYYSPERPQEEYVRREKRDDRQYRYEDEAYRDDRYLRMKIRNRRWSGLYDDYYSYNPYYYHYYNGSLAFNSPWSSVSYWNHYYNPSCPVVVLNPSRPVYNKPRTFDLGVYNPQPVFTGKGSRQYANGGYVPYNSNSRNSSNYRGSGSSAGNFLRDA
ncbi:MAG TPA: hypothetical protein VFR58_02200, partial [Flavisolibacter sp.]|nr:hypothetical protein [Flavisolibacter sp.]